MTNYTVASAKHATLAANVADKVTFTGSPGAVEVLNRGTTPIYFTVGSAPAPTVGGDDTNVVTAGGSMRVQLGLPDQVQLIASAVTDYSVTGY